MVTFTYQNAKGVLREITASLTPEEHLGREFYKLQRGDRWISSDMIVRVRNPESASATFQKNNLELVGGFSFKSDLFQVRAKTVQEAIAFYLTYSDDFLGAEPVFFEWIGPRV